MGGRTSGRGQGLDAPALRQIERRTDSAADYDRGTAVAADQLDSASPTLVEEDEEEVETKVLLADLIREPVIGGKTRCPFHDDTTPSLQIYSDHFHCYVCGAHGDQVDWLVQVEGRCSRPGRWYPAMHLADCQSFPASSV